MTADSPEARRLLAGRLRVLAATYDRGAELTPPDVVELYAVACDLVDDAHDGAQALVADGFAVGDDSQDAESLATLYDDAADALNDLGHMTAVCFGLGGENCADAHDADEADDGDEPDGAA